MPRGRDANLSLTHIHTGSLASLCPLSGCAYSWPSGSGCKYYSEHESRAQVQPPPETHTPRRCNPGRNERWQIEDFQQFWGNHHHLFSLLKSVKSKRTLFTYELFIRAQSFIKITLLMASSLLIFQPPVTQRHFSLSNQFLINKIKSCPTFILTEYPVRWIENTLTLPDNVLNLILTLKINLSFLLLSLFNNILNE